MPGFKHFAKDLHRRQYKVDHPDYAVLQQIKDDVWNKKFHKNGKEEMKKEIESIVDFDSLTAFSAEIVDDLTESLDLGEPPDNIKAMLVTLVATGFVSGYNYQERRNG